ncbi:hypothetical protein, partial [Dialister hominis]
SVRKSDKKFYKKFKKYQKIKIGACSCVAGLLLPEQGKRHSSLRRGQLGDEKQKKSVLICFELI